MTVIIPKFETPGERIKYIREKLLKLSRADIQKKYGLSPDTLAAWESLKINISEKGIFRCIQIFNSENLIVSREWIISGEGLSPNFSFDLSRYFNTVSSDSTPTSVDDNFLLIKEVEFFRSLSQNSVTALISTDDMLPFYARGDYVGGRYIYGKKIEDCVGKDCIIKTTSENIFIRRLAKNSKLNGYNLMCLNAVWNGNPEPVIFDVQIECAAPIIWHRRMDI